MNPSNYAFNSDNKKLLKGAQIMFYVLILFLGVSMTCMGLAIQTDMSGDKSQCPESVRNSNTIVIVLGVVLLTAAIFKMWSTYTYRNCAGKSDVTTNHLIGYYVFVLVVSIMLTRLGAVMKNDVDDKATITSLDCKKIKTKANFIMTVGIIGMVLTLTPILLLSIKMGSEKAYKYNAKSSSA